MNPQCQDETLARPEILANSPPFAAEFEMAYQVRIAIERIRFAIRHAEQFGKPTNEMREAALQLLDALERLELVDRRFQRRSRVSRNGNGQCH
jgi:hypothetical protein